MAKTIRNEFERLCSFEKLWLAYQKARRGKRYADAVARFDRDAEVRLLELSAELREGRYCPGAYRHFYIHEPKKRKISAAPFRDRVVHHAVCRVIEPPWERRFVSESFANRRGKGASAAREGGGRLDSRRLPDYRR